MNRSWQQSGILVWNIYFFFFFNISVSDLRTYLNQSSSEKETWWEGGYGLVWSINHIITKVPRKYQLWGLFSPLLWTVGYLKWSLWTDFMLSLGPQWCSRASPFPPPALPGAPKVFATAWICSQKCSIQPLFLGKVSDFWAKLKQNKSWVPTTSPTAAVPLPCGSETSTEDNSARFFLHLFLKSFI